MKIAVIGPFPPPHHGFSAMMSAMAERFERTTEVVRIDTSSNQRKAILRHTVQAALYLLAAVRILAIRKPQSWVIALGCNGGFGAWYTLLLATAARTRGIGLTVHHHSYRYILERQTAINLLSRITKNNSVHVFLSRSMRDDFSQTYSAPIRDLVLSNATFVKWNATDKSRTNRQELTIGFLSNLSEEKGLLDFLQLARKAKAAGSGCIFHLAGPVKLERDRILIEAAVAAGDVAYYGSLYGEEKERFYQELDLFVFPTKYAFEAQPVVIYEALASGVTVFSYRRGCIADQVGDAGSTANSFDELLDHLLRTEEKFRQTPELRSRVWPERAIEKFRQDVQEGDEAIIHLTTAHRLEK